MSGKVLGGEVAIAANLKPVQVMRVSGVGYLPGVWRLLLLAPSSSGEWAIDAGCTVNQRITLTPSASLVDNVEVPADGDALQVTWVPSAPAAGTASASAAPYWGLK